MADPDHNPEETAEDDFALFRQEMQGARPLDQDRVRPWKKRKPPIPMGHLPPEKDPALVHERDLRALPAMEAGEELGYRRPGLQDRVFQDLRRGRIEIEEELDLHGLTVRYAREVLGEFFDFCHRHRIRCVRIIHGKGAGSQSGQPVLKQFLKLWLEEREDILAFCSATSRDGGTGAAYVLLRSPERMQKKRQRRR